MHKNKELELASDFIEKTDRTVFLTGKAGTGKTTFLHQIKAHSLKRLVVVAPTGVAAINAKGVTIHSFFQMPFGPILPDGAQTQNASGFQRKFNKKKIDIIKSLDLLIIDEISMVRADLLDGIDRVLRRYKNRDKVFGGVQVLMIGDLQQLAPVVKENEWELLKPYYNTPYFFSSKAFMGCNPINIELTHIYRQDNDVFINILNEIRTNTLSQQAIEMLNKRYLPNFIPPKDSGYITLTTHNNRAAEMNAMELESLNVESIEYNAHIEGNFPEYTFPTHETLSLKKGAQVMFIKNDSSQDKQYFNGKIGKIVDLDKDKIIVRCPGDAFDIEAVPEIWENVNYIINPETKEITENVVGSFEQIPLRLAWAITIHKSQGLTFDKAIIDAEASFAHGQTYVALSRCRTLEGMVFKSPISQRSIISDGRVMSFSQHVAENLPDADALNASQKVYQLNLMADLFNYYALLQPVKRLIDLYYTNKNSIIGTMIDPLLNIKDEGITKLLQINNGFTNQLKELSKTIQAPENDDTIQERLKKGITYFIKHTEDYIKIPLNTINYSTDNKAVEKDIEKQLEQLHELLSIKMYCLNGLEAGFSTRTYLELRAKAVLQKSTVTPTKKEPVTTTKHPILFAALRALRHQFAESLGIDHFQVFTQKTLFEMCETLPTTINQLRAVNGMGKVRVEKYGAKIIEAIQRYCDSNDITTKTDPVEKKKTLKKGESQKISLQFFKDGLAIPEIAKERGLAIGTIESHLIGFVNSGELNVTDIIPEDKYLELKKIMQETSFETITELKNKIDDKFTYNEIRLVGMEI